MLAELGAVAAPLSSRAVVITDTNVGPLYADAAVAALSQSDVRTEVIDFPAGEGSKDLSTYAAVMDRLLALTPPIDRGCLIVALGGDGTIIRAVHLLGDALPPILGVNYGRLGFLTGANPDSMTASVDTKELVAGAYSGSITADVTP